MRKNQNVFEERVYTAARAIPKGRVATYGQIAKLAGNARAARAVGGYMRRNIGASHCPCHRVVGSDGSLVGYAFGGVGEKRKLLIDEGVSFRGSKVNLATSLWNGR